MAPMWKGLSVPNEDDEGKADRPLSVQTRPYGLAKLDGANFPVHR